MDRWKKQRWEESEGRRKEVRRSGKRKSEKKEDAGARKGRKAAMHCVFSNDLWLWRVQMRDEKLHAVVARSTFPSQKCQKLTVSDHFCKFRCRKSVRRCGAKHISKSKVSKHTTFSALFGSWEVEKVQWTPLWREAHFQVKSVKTAGFEPCLMFTSAVEKVHTNYLATYLLN